MSFAPTRSRLAGLAGLLALLALPPAADAGILDGPEKPKLASSGNRGELIEEVPISTTPGAEERTAFTVGPQGIPRIQAGDRLRFGGEVQVSTTCASKSPRCIGRRYRRSPFVSARIELAGPPGSTAPPITVVGPEQVRCKQKRPERNHHCTLALENTEVTIPDPAAMPCPPNECYVNLIVGAHHRKAKPGNVVVLGGDRPDGSVVQDKGRLNVAHVREEAPAADELFSDFPLHPDLPLTEPNKVKRRVVYTVELPPVKKGDVLAIDGSYIADIGHLRFNTYLGTRLIVADNPHAVDPAGVAKTAPTHGGEASEANGFNCTQGPSGYRTPCTVEKSGAIRFEQAPVNELGLPVPLYVNLVASAKPLLTDRVKDKHRVRILPGGGLRVFRLTG